MDLIRRNQSGKVNTSGQPQLSDLPVQRIVHRPVPDHQQPQVRELPAQPGKRRNHIFVPLHREKPGDDGNHPCALRNAELAPQLRIRSGIRKLPGVHAAVNHFIKLPRSDLRFDTLVDHRLRHRENPVGPPRGNPFGHPVNKILPRLFIRRERLPVNRVNHHRNSGATRGNPAENPRF